DYLLARRLTGQTPRQRHYVERLFVLVSDSGRNRVAAGRLDSALRTAPDSLKVQLLRIGSALGDSAFLPAARRYLRADSAEVRRMALRGLGAYPARADLPFLLEHAVATSGPERQMTLWALAQHPPLREWKTVLPLLRDPRQYNRQLARRILAKAWGGDFAKGLAFAPSLDDATADTLPRLEWALLAAEMPGPTAQAWLRRALPVLDPAGRVFFRGSRPRPSARPAP
ncbi:MAG TPA: HEAT repeat domain-containing protein, partial [Fibrobacteria bacterium]|nr:HEAT repeat domain-containing protein [Fibrobacteria bacterium]